MSGIQPCSLFFSGSWKEKYGAIVSEEHLRTIDQNIQRFKDGTLDWHLPYFNEEILIDRKQSFGHFIHILETKDQNEEKARQLEEIPFEYWLDVLGQRLTSASVRDEQAIPPLKDALIGSCQVYFNKEITIAQRAWEKHVGRTDDQFWGEVKGSNFQKQEKVMAKIHYIIENKTWWNVFFHYKHGVVYEIREKEGHGIRWASGGTQLIGFLETFINE
ncbi:hypothetical protein ACNFU2_17725 [Chryseobacterium sp. PTM-20240506]|uniref:hypothetical protein n=1 Tax=unclassified Chryseobacterium TaxID=2593645 RepID=UPI002358BEA2|nr:MULTISPECIES: hypothetical protein [unclassified Chryseobacterium]MDC8106730.1 hypothetical protein [Chryseobacterium sp. B21-037]MDQ1805993.1 hypothetical protein [Chryseobacterium sp. CKR4-1]